MAQAQNWQMVWQDEFNGGISGDWVFETGAGGWGNNELQYYRRENASVQNGNLVLTAKREAFGGSNYTSVRMKTQGKKSWKYGKIEARIAMPSFQGIWPAFWMLGDNISSVGWPNCGEIDIMEHVNTGNQSFGTIHWSAGNGAYAQYGGNTGVNNITTYHNYTVEWDANLIKWFIDGVKFHEVSIANGVNGTSEFHNNFFILLNLAVGGNWPGFAIDNNAFPTSMLVDYVRVYQNNGTPPPPGGLTNLAGNYYLQNRHSGQYMDISGGATADGAKLLQWPYNGQTNQQFELVHLGNGTYKITAKHSNRSLDVEGVSTADGAKIQQWGYGGGANQQFTALDAGDGFIKLRAVHSGKIVEVGGWSTTAGGNVQQWTDNNQASGHWKLVPVVTVPAFSRLIQAEAYNAMAGVQLENCNEGGQNVGYIDNGDWMAYNSINIPSSGSYRLDYRVASVNGGRLSADINAGATVLGTVNIPATGGWQNWTTVSQTVYLNAGTYNFGIFASTGGWNINWWNITRVSGARTSEDEATLNVDGNEEMQLIYLSPNPASDKLYMTTDMNVENGEVKIYNRLGALVLTSPVVEELNISSLEPGVYSLMFTNGTYSKVRKFVKL